jgi:aminoglycoside phosphotransferase family enzyme/predicted kinase
MTPQSPETDQSAALALLADPATHGGAAVERLDTHISAVFLAGERVVKLKKAVDLGFVDFTTLEARRAACENEVALNRRTAADLYLGVAAIQRRADGAVVLGAAGAAPEAAAAVVDWAVVMRRFDGEQLFDRLAERNALSRPLILDLAEEIAAFHGRAEPCPGAGGAAAVAAVIRGNAGSLRRHLNTVFSAAEIDALLARSLAEAERLAPLLNARAAAGKVRRAHGDLHLGNIALWRGRPLIFDGIEFNDAFAVIDVLYDLSFLLMDLRFRGLGRRASQVLNHYMDITGDTGGLPALPLMLSMRAQIRAHVSAATALGAADPGPLRATARAYFAFAETALETPPPCLVAVGGLSGSGKSRCARELAPRLGGATGALVLRTDVLRKRLAGLKPWESLPKSAYTPEMAAKTYAALYAEAAAALAGGWTVIADAVFARPEERAAIAAVAAEAAVPFAGLWLEAAPKVAEKRIVKRRRNASDASPQVLRAQLGYDTGPIDWPRIDSGGAKAKTDGAALAGIAAQCPAVFDRQKEK